MLYLPVYCNNGITCNTFKVQYLYLLKQSDNTVKLICYWAKMAWLFNLVQNSELLVQCFSTSLEKKKVWVTELHSGIFYLSWVFVNKFLFLFMIYCSFWLICSTYFFESAYFQRILSLQDWNWSFFLCYLLVHCTKAWDEFVHCQLHRCVGKSVRTTEVYA